MIKELQVETKENPVVIIPDITYSQVTTSMHDINMPLKMSIIMPVVPKPVPLIIWLEGGGWRTLNPLYALGELAYYAKKGYAVASLQYRVSSQGAFPSQLIDVKAGIRYLRQHAGKFQLDTKKIGIMGRSSGGHLAVMAGLTNGDRRFDKGDFLDQSSDVDAVGSFYSPIELNGFYDWLVENKKGFFALNIDALLGTVYEKNSKLAEKASPINFVSKNAPPHIIFQGDRDTFVPAEQSRILYDALVKEGVPADLYILKKAAHGSFEFDQTEIKELVYRFFEKYL